MIGFILNTLAQKLSKTIKPANDSESIQALLRCFRQGIRDGIYRIGKRVKNTQDAIPWERRIFYREGYAFGLACRHSASLLKRNPDVCNYTSDYRIMHFTGYGFYQGVAEIYHLPKLSFHPSYWKNVPDYDSYGPFLIGGKSFAKTLFCDWDKDYVQSWESLDLEIETKAAWHGCGRCLWFCHNHNFADLIKALEIYEPATQDLAFGLGIAITFTQISNPEKIISDLSQFPCHLQEDLQKGAGIALTAIIEEHPGFQPHIDRLYSQKLKRYWSIAEKAHQQAPKDLNWYQEAIQQIAQA